MTTLAPARLLVLALLVASPEHDGDEPVLLPDPPADSRCGCLQWAQRDGGYVCVRPVCPPKRAGPRAP